MSEQWLNPSERSKIIWCSNGLTTQERALLQAVSQHMHTTNWAWPNQPTLCRMTGLSVRTVRRCSVRLEAAGIIERTEPCSSIHYEIDWARLTALYNEQLDERRPVSVTAQPVSVTAQPVSVTAERETERETEGGTVVLDENEDHRRHSYDSTDPRATPLNGRTDDSTAADQPIDPADVDLQLRIARLLEQSGTPATQPNRVKPDPVIEEWDRAYKESQYALYRESQAKKQAERDRINQELAKGEPYWRKARDKDNVARAFFLRECLDMLLQLSDSCGEAGPRLQPARRPPNSYAQSLLAGIDQLDPAVSLLDFWGALCELPDRGIESRAWPVIATEEVWYGTAEAANAAAARRSRRTA